MPRRNIGKSFSAVDLYGKALSFQRVSPIFDAFSVDLVFFRLRQRNRHSSQLLNSQNLHSDGLAAVSVGEPMSKGRSWIDVSSKLRISKLDPWTNDSPTPVGATSQP